MAPLRSIRRKHLLSQQDLAQRARVTAGTIHLIETGRSEPRLFVMRRLCETLNVHPSEVDEFRRLLEPEVEMPAQRRAA